MTVWDAYERISDDATAEGEGVNRQQQDTEQAVKALGGTVVMHHTENDTSAYKKTKVSVTDQYGNTYDAYRVNRPKWAAALQRLRTGEAKRLMVYDLDRLARDPRDLEDAIEVVEHYGAEIRSATASEVDLTTQTGQLTARLMVNMAYKSSADTARRVARKKRQNREEGKRQGGRYRTYGYDRQWNVIDAEAAVVKEAFTRRADGESITAIATDFTARGLVNVNGKAWNAGNLGKILDKADYAGFITYEGEIVSKAAFPSIIDEALYLAVKDKMVARSRKGQSARVHVLTGFLICNECGTSMKGNGSANNYRCPSPKDVPTACGSRTCKKDSSEEYIFNAAFAKSQDKDPLKKDTPTRDYEAEAKVIEAEIEQTHQLRKSGDLPLVDAVPILKDLRSKHAALLKEQQSEKPLGDLWHFQTFLDFEQMNLSQQKLWLGQYINYVVVHAPTKNNRLGFDPERLEVHFTDGTVRRLEKGTIVHDVEVGKDGP